MDREFAILLINACFRASREMGQMGTMVREFTPDETGDAVKSQIGYAMAEIGKVMSQVYEAHPDLETYVEHQIDKFGQVS